MHHVLSLVGTILGLFRKYSLFGFYMFCFDPILQPGKSESLKLSNQFFNLVLFYFVGT